MIQEFYTKKHAGEHFVYAGFCFMEESEKRRVKAHYRNVLNTLKQGKGLNGEIKGCNSPREVKHKVYKAMKNFQSVGVAVDINEVYSWILKDNKSREDMI